MRRSMANRRILIVIGIIVAIIVIGAIIAPASWKREWKSVWSDVSGGLDRTVTVYDYNGNPIKQWSGRFDISESDGEIFFDDENNKRVIIHGGIVICEEN